MHGVKAGQRYEIVLGNTRFKTVGPVRPTLLAQYPEKQLFGEPGPDDEPLLSNWVIADSRAGGGVDILDPRDRRHVGRHWFSTAWTLTRNMITLPPKATDCGKPNSVVVPWVQENFVQANFIQRASEISVAEPVLTWDYGGFQWFVFGAKVYRWVDTSSTWSSELYVLPSPPTDVAVYRKNTAEVVVVLACGPDTVTYDGTTWTVHTGTASSWLATWDDKVWKMDSQGQLAWSSDPAANAWTNDSVLRLPGNSVTGLLVGPHPERKDPVIYVVTTQGLHIHDAGGPLIQPTDFVFPGKSGAGQGSARWRHWIFYNARDLGIYQVNTVDSTVPVVTPVGLDLDDGLPRDMQGTVLKLVPTHNWLVGLLDSAKTEAPLELGTDPAFASAVVPAPKGYTSIWAWNEVGWHCLYRSGPQAKPGRILAVSQVYGDYRLWFNSDGAVRYIRLDQAISNPRHNSVREFEPSATYITPAQGAGTAQDKLGVALKLFTEGCSTTETVQVYVEYDRSGVWVPVGTITTNGRTVYTFETDPGESNGRVYDYIRFRFDLARGADETARPVIAYAVHPYLNLLDRVLGFDVVVDCTGPYGPKTAHGLRHALIQAAQTKTLLNFSYQDDANNVHTYKVTVLALTGEERGNTVDKGLFNLKLAMVSSANMPEGWT